MYPPIHRDCALERRIRRELYHAAGYAQPNGPAAPSLLETALLAEVGNPAAVAAWIELIRAHRELGAEGVRALGATQQPRER